MKHMIWNTHDYLPIRSSKIRMPMDQQSAPKSWPLFMMTSGATYSGVPQNVQVFLPSPIFLAKPKSVWKKQNSVDNKDAQCKSETLLQTPIQSEVQKSETTSENYCITNNHKLYDHICVKSLIENIIFFYVKPDDNVLQNYLRLIIIWIIWSKEHLVFQ